MFQNKTKRSAFKINHFWTGQVSLTPQTTFTSFFCILFMLLIRINVYAMLSSIQQHAIYLQHLSFLNFKEENPRISFHFLKIKCFSQISFKGKALYTAISSLLKFINVSRGEKGISMGYFVSKLGDFGILSWIANVVS